MWLILVAVMQNELFEFRKKMQILREKQNTPNNIWHLALCLRKEGNLGKLPL